jgi:hypothetical protein
MKTSPLAGKPAQPGIPVDVPRHITAYFTEVPGSSLPAQAARTIVSAALVAGPTTGKNRAAQKPHPMTMKEAVAV